MPPVTYPVVFEFDPVAFRLMFPVYSDDGRYPTPVLQMKWDIGTAYISDRNCGRLNNGRRATALNLITAHLLMLDQMFADNESSTGSGMITSATVDKVSVTVLAPPISDAWDWWLMQTPYGVQLLALLQVAAAGGFYVGGMPERDAFRQVYGVFPGRFNG